MILRPRVCLPKLAGGQAKRLRVIPDDGAGNMIACAMPNGLYGKSDRNRAATVKLTTGVIAMCCLNGRW